MKAKNIKLIIALLIASIAYLVAWQYNKRINTTVHITSITSSPGDANTSRVNFRVNGGPREFTIIVLPDTQNYSKSYPEIFMAQTEWIAANKESLNIVFVSHLGDLVDDHDLFEYEWVNADAAMSLLDGIVPYGVLPGNHDMQPDGSAVFYERYFPASRYEGQDWWGGSFDNNRYNYQLFSAGGDDYIILHMQFIPTKQGLFWAQEVLQQHPNRKAIISTHGYLTETGDLLSDAGGYNTNGEVSPAMLWRRLIKPNSNVFLVLSGHVFGVSRKTETLSGRFVHQLLADYQIEENGGNGYLRILTFQPQYDRVLVSTYSPYTGEFRTDEDNQFELPFDMTGGPLPSGTVTIYNGSERCSAPVTQGYCEISATPTENQIYRAVYIGDFRYQGSRSVKSVVPIE